MVEGGNLLISLAVERVELKVEEEGKVVAFNSSATNEPHGPGRIVLRRVKTLIGPKFRMKMNDRGEVVEREPSDDPLIQNFAVEQFGERVLSPTLLLSRVETVGPGWPKEAIGGGYTWESGVSSEPAEPGKKRVQKTTYVGEVQRGGGQRR